MSLAQAAKLATVFGVVLAAIIAGFSGLAWATTQAIDYSTIKSTVAAHTDTLKRIETKLDAIQSEVKKEPTK
jgi:hypothetical protein